MKNTRCINNISEKKFKVTRKHLNHKFTKTCELKIARTKAKRCVCEISMIVNPVFSKSGKGLILILRHQTEKPKTSQSAAQETQTSNLIKRRENLRMRVYSDK